MYSQTHFTDTRLIRTRTDCFVPGERKPGREEGKNARGEGGKKAPGGGGKESPYIFSKCNPFNTVTFYDALSVCFNGV